MCLSTRLQEYLWPMNRRIHLHECFLFSKETLVGIRMFFFLFSFGIYMMSNINKGSFYKNYMYLTYWGEVLTMLTFLTLLLDNLFHLQGYYRNEKFEETMLTRAAHVIFEIAFSYELSIVLMYWMAVYPSATDAKTSFFYTTNILVHGTCFALLWVENIVNYIEFFPRHIIIVIIVGLAYVVDNVIVVFCINHDTVYKVLKWTDLASYFYVLGCLLVAILHFFLGWAIFWKCKYKKWGMSLTKKVGDVSPGFIEFQKEASVKS